jgi:hypothetical protein
MKEKGQREQIYAELDETRDGAHLNSNVFLSPSISDPRRKRRTRETRKKSSSLLADSLWSLKQDYPNPSSALAQI